MRMSARFGSFALLALAACTTTTGSHDAPQPAPLGAGSPVPAPASQLLVVTTGSWEATTGELRRFVRDHADAPWRAEGAAIPVVVGRTGLAWGVGFEPVAARGGGTAGPLKREGDGRAPAGVFPLGTAFGFAPPDSVGDVRVPYLQLTPSVECVDDPASVHYNRIVDRGTVTPVDWSSSERMRAVTQYRLGVAVDYNTPPVPRRGSCIFLHIWAGPESTTVGCTAMAADALARLVAWLDPRAAPVLVQLPAPVYGSLRVEWNLPALPAASQRE